MRPSSEKEKKEIHEIVVPIPRRENRASVNATATNLDFSSQISWLGIMPMVTTRTESRASSSDHDKDLSSLKG